ncbi:S41 family peptidase [Shewanella gelidii]|uniref:Tricorn protease homolog n=1 Tax=Shewanella gelidii TaxID=1642821 RepID=A0A917JKU9_9GAMM|nr:S41 family peptidase [Shewanella gelidii]MCL1096560.1 S41 family peptidase [Shewanella gelidii]GGI68401.1 tricorn protease [Shewanella gelidii]
MTRFRSSLKNALIFSLLSSALHSQFVVAKSPQSADMQGYYRMPALHEQTLVFTAEGDLWKKSQDESHAQRLTSLAAEEKNAAISPNGKWVAFSANYEGTTEAYVIGIAGGQAKRVSFENSRVRVQGWTPSGHVLYATDNAQGPTNRWVLKLVHPETLEVADIPLADAIEGAVDDAEKNIFFTRFGLQATGDNAKVYRGGAKGELWRFQLGSQQEATRLAPQHEGSMRQPMAGKSRLFFVSDQDGNPNIWSMTYAGEDLKQHTHFVDWQVRDAQLYRDSIVFQLGADIQHLDIETNQIKKLTTTLVSDFSQRREQWVQQPMKYVEHAQISPSGEQAVITARGHVAIAATDGRRLVEIGDGKSRIRSALMSHDGQWIYAISDASGEQEVWRYPANGQPEAKQLTYNGQTLRMSLSLSPDGRYLAHDDYDGNVWLLDLKKSQQQKIVTDGEGLGPYADLVWSADSNFLALTKQQLGHSRSQIVLYSVKEKRTQAITSDKYESFSPSFSSDGQWLYFLSNREFNATPSSPWGDRNLGPQFNRRTQIFAVSLSEQAAFPFKKPNELTTTVVEGDEKSQPHLAKIDWNNLSMRLWQVPVVSGNYSRLNVLEDKLFFIEHPAAGTPRLKILKVDALKPKLDTFAEDVADYQLSADQSKMLVRKHSQKGRELLIIDAGEKIATDLSLAKVRTEQWQLKVTPQIEWSQMFDDAWLMHRDSFYDKKMRGTNWVELRQKYLPLVARLTDRHELNDIFKQMMGELNALHSQVRGGDSPVDGNTAKAASLGALLKQTDKGVKISSIYQDDPELPQMASPLATPGVDAKNGDRLVAINHKPVSTVADVTRLLRNQAGKQVLLTLKRGRDLHQTVAEPVTVKAANKMRYRHWVTLNSQQVANLSNQKMGYLHLYAMGAKDIANFAREFYANINKQGLIIDVRRNRGGNIDSWIIEKLLRKTWAFWQPTHGTASGNMQQTYRGHLVVLTDQLTYSDGETFAAGIKSLGIAPLIGKQTAGAGVWLSGRNRLTDKGMARVAEYPQYAMDGSWIIEGRGVSPNIEVDNLPYASFQGKDAQLEAAFDYLANQIKSSPVTPLKALPIPSDGAAKDVRPLGL